MKDKTVGGLRCSQVLAVLSEYLDGELDSTMVKAIEKHLLGCANCERFGKSFGTMVVSLRHVPVAAWSVDAAWLADLYDRIDQLNAES